MQIGFPFITGAAIVMPRQRFRHPRSLVAAIVLSVAAGTGSAHAASQSIQIGGTGAGLGTMTALADAFAASRPDVAITVLPSLGSSGGVHALVEGAVDIAVTARPLKPAEAENDLREMHLASSPFMLVTSHGDPDRIEPDALAGIFSNPVASWSDGTPILIILRPESDSTNDMLHRYFSGMDQALAAARLRPDVPMAATDQDNIKLAQRLPGSLTAASLTQIVTEDADLRALPLDDVEPTLENLASGAYPPRVDLYLIVRNGNEEMVASFVDYIRSEAGRRVLRATGNLPARDIVAAD